MSAALASFSGAMTASAEAGSLVTDGADDDSDAGETLELVSFIVNGQEYALPIDRVQEIAQAPETVTEVPNADHRVLGVMDLRGRLLPVVSLRRIFGLPEAGLEAHNRIVVVPLAGPDNTRSDNKGGSIVGVVMDTVRQVLRVPKGLVDPLPGFVASSGQGTEVDSVCRLEDGKRLVSVISADRMFAVKGLRDTIEAEQDDKEAREVEGDELVDADRSDEAQLVVFRVDDEEYGVVVDEVQEIIRVPEQLIRVPKALDFVEGLVNLRGTVLPVIDLRSRLGLPRSQRDERQRIVVLIINGARTGFIVDSVTEVLKLRASAVDGAEAVRCSSRAHLQCGQPGRTGTDVAHPRHGAPPGWTTGRRARRRPGRLRPRRACHDHRAYRGRFRARCGNTSSGYWRRAVLTSSPPATGRRIGAGPRGHPTSLPLTLICPKWMGSPACPGSWPKAPDRW